jgi:hypothetical protein
MKASDSDSATELPQLAVLPVTHVELHLIMHLLSTHLASMAGDLIDVIRQTQYIEADIEMLGAEGLDAFATKLSTLHRGMCK